MAKAQTQYVCQNCGTAHRKWAGQCTGCNEWNTLVEEELVERKAGSRLPGMAKKGGKAAKLGKLADQREESVARLTCGMAEFDRVTGGGLVPGSALLIGGDPGIGKSTVLLQVSAALAKTGKSAVYITAEESGAQVRLRASRMGLAEAPVDLAAMASVSDILATLDALSTPPDLLVIDSIQTVFVEALDSAPGTVAQVRSAAQELIGYAKARNTALILVGHVTKDGQIAGPRVLEHMVDTVLYFEGDRGHRFRILRAVKNRFGATDEIGVFEMTELGLMEVSNPSALFLGDRQSDVAGTAVFAGMEGTRPMLVEIQALVAPSSFGTPRRAVVGWDSGRLSMVLAVLEARAGLNFAGQDIYLNVAGGLRISEPAADMAAAAALVSALLDRPLDNSLVLIGEVALTGTLRPVGQSDTRLKEAEKLGFTRAIVPKGGSALKGGSLRLDRPANINALTALIREG